MSRHTNEQIEALRQNLLKDKADIERRLKENDHFGLNDPISAIELSAYDNHPADIGTEMFERGKDIALNEREEHRLKDIDNALSRMDQGTYGICLTCGKEIPYERLKVVPSAEYCVEHVPDKEMSERRPVEEQILQPPFGRTSLDELPEQNQFDGEDAWQIVESWGNSDSPAMAEDPEVHDYDSMYIEADENEGFVESIESFLATDLYGNEVSIVRNKQYREYMNKNEGEPLLEPDEYAEELESGGEYEGLS